MIERFRQLLTPFFPWIGCQPRVAAKSEVRVDE
jgi:hypothetical protein